jgi:hypothetical protein
LRCAPAIARALGQIAEQACEIAQAAALWLDAEERLSFAPEWEYSLAEMPSNDDDLHALTFEGLHGVI